MVSPRLDLLVVADSGSGGLGASARAHVEWFSRAGWSVGFAAPGLVVGDAAGTVSVSLPVLESVFDVRAVLRAAETLRGVLRRHQPEVVHVHGTRSQLVTLMAGRRAFVTMHGGGRVAGQGLVGTLIRRTGRRLSPLLARAAYSAAPAPGWQTLLHASPRLVDLDRQPIPDESSVPTFLWIGRLDAPKRPEDFVRACALAARHRPLVGVVIGDGPMGDQVRKMSEEMNAPVTFLGERSDVDGHLARAWAMCLFSDFEGVPFAVQEAMWAGRAVVLSDLSNLRWFAGEAGRYASDVETAAAELIALTDHAVAVRSGAASAERARLLLTEDAPFPQLLSDYRGARR